MNKPFGVSSNVDHLLLEKADVVMLEASAHCTMLLANHDSGEVGILTIEVRADVFASCFISRLQFEVIELVRSLRWKDVVRL